MNIVSITKDSWMVKVNHQLENGEIREELEVIEGYKALNAIVLATVLELQKQDKPFHLEVHELPHYPQIDAYLNRN